jgi:hypothetical protein
MSRKDELSAKHQEETERIRAWLRPFMEDNKPKMATKEELWAVAKKKFGVSRSSFNGGWILAIFDTGREDWFEPMRKRLKKQ